MSDYSVSVCMATFNGERFIKKQIDSILCQLNDKDELVISDDNSTDSTTEILNSYEDKRIKIYRHGKGRSGRTKKISQFKVVAENFENTLRYASGNYILLSDQDDIWLENRIKSVVTYLEFYDMVICNFSVINQYDDILKEKYYDKDPISRNLIINVIRSKFLGCCMAFKRELLRYILPFPENVIAHDFWIGNIGTAIGRHYFIDVPLHAYRRYEGTVSTSTSKSKNSLFFKIYYRIEILLALVYRLLIKKLI
jgi:glycosyltransferase involved in cell wall biosynthesis